MGIVHISVLFSVVKGNPMAYLLVNKTMTTILLGGLFLLLWLRVFLPCGINGWMFKFFFSTIFYRDGACFSGGRMPRIFISV